MKASELKHFSLATAIDVFARCEYCHSVVEDLGMSEHGHPCPLCGHGSRGGLAWLPLTAHTLIALMQETYHSKPHVTALPRGELEGVASASGLGTLIFYCTLGEVLLAHFLEDLMTAQGLDGRTRGKLLNAHRHFRQRVDVLLPALTKCSWDTAISRLRSQRLGDFRSVSSFHRRAVDARNTLLHSGYRWADTPSLARRCMDKVPALVRLFVALHNLFVAHPRQKAGRLGRTK